MIGNDSEPSFLIHVQIVFRHNVCKELGVGFGSVFKHPINVTLIDNLNHIGLKHLVDLDLTLVGRCLFLSSKTACFLASTAALQALDGWLYSGSMGSKDPTSGRPSSHSSSHPAILIVLSAICISFCLIFPLFPGILKISSSPYSSSRLKLVSPITSSSSCKLSSSSRSSEVAHW